MSEPVEMVAEEARRKADQSLLLARVLATAVAFVFGVSGLLAGLAAGPFRDLFVATGAELPSISRVVIGLPALWSGGYLVLTTATLCFIWAKGRTAAWMAGLGLWLLAFGLPVLVLALLLPLIRIIGGTGAP